MSIKCCKGCTDRWVEGIHTCHDTCERYSTARAADYERKKVIYEARAKENIVDRFHNDVVARTKKRLGR